MRVRAAAAATRLMFVVGLIASTALIADVDPGAVRRAGLAAAFVWVPVASGVLAIQMRRAHWGLDLVAVLADLVMITALLGVVGGDSTAVLVVLVGLAGLHTFIGGPRVGAAAVIGAIASPAVAHQRWDLGVDAFTVAAVAAGAISLSAFGLMVRRETALMGEQVGRAQEKADTVVSGAYEALVITGPRGAVHQYNRSAELTLDCDRDPPTHCRDLGLHRDLTALDCRAQCALFAAGGDVEVWRTRGDGIRQPLLANVSPLRDQNGRVVEVVHSFRDITRVKRAEEAKTLFLATASHEMKTPLTVILGFASMLRSSPHTIDHDVALEAITTRAEELLSKVEGLLMSSRIEAGQIQLDPVAGDVGPVLTERVEALHSTSDHTISLSIPPGLPPALHHASALGTVLDHLVENAVKYSPPEAPIDVTVSADSDAVSVAVRDRGIGMTSEEAAHCFDQFWQAEATETRRYGGTGIGLYIVKSLVEGMQGAISVESELGTGSVFTISLPRSDVTRPDPSADGDGDEAGRRSIIREFMRQVGVGGGS